MSSTSDGSGTRRRMKLLSRDRSSATISEILRSCSFIEMMLTGSSIHYCRRTRATNIVEILLSLHCMEVEEGKQRVDARWIERVARSLGFVARQHVFYPPIRNQPDHRHCNVDRLGDPRRKQCGDNRQDIKQR